MAALPRNLTKMYARRKEGMYHTKDTLNESRLCMAQMQDTDMCYTLMYRHGVFNVYNKKEFLPQMALWKKLGCYTLAENFFEREIDGKKAYLVVITPPEALENSTPAICPLSSAHGFLVSGLTYVFKKKSDAELLQHYLSQDKSDDPMAMD
jgi:hypothetical protein